MGLASLITTATDPNFTGGAKEEIKKLKNKEWVGMHTVILMSGGMRTKG